MSQEAMLSFFLGTSESKFNIPANGDFVTALYRNILKREPDTGGWNAWVGALNAGQSRTSVTMMFLGSTEFTERSNNRVNVGLLYMAYLRRTAQPGEVSFWGVFLGGSSLTGATTYFLQSVEYLDRY